MDNSYSFLRNVPLFADLDDADLEQICSQVEEVRLEPGQILFEEGSLGQHAYVIREGKIEIYTEANGHSIQLAVRQSGEVIGEISLLESTPRNASGRALTDTLLYAVGQEQFDKLLNTNPSAARTMLQTVTARLRSFDQMLHQNEKMAQLGTLTAGIAHELNNPASAVKRGVDQLLESFTRFQEASLLLQDQHLSNDQMRALMDMNFQTNLPASFDPLERNDQERRMEAWLDDIGTEKSWEKAPLLVDLGYDPGTLKGALEKYATGSQPAVIDWIVASANIHNISGEISMGASRISEIVKALKSYVYLDQGPLQSVSIQEGLENTLVILQHKINQGITIQAVFDPAVPPIQAYGSELNQVWTNIIDNAIDALDGRGKITIRTSFKDPWIMVDIADNGPGIPAEIQKKLFSPFFTTKPLAKGTGLGLNISYNIIHKHGGDVKVISQPGETHFEVWLPKDFKKVNENPPMLQPIHRGDDNSLREILLRVKNIAVVGITNRPDLSSTSVPAYLKSMGYHIFPVNPREERILGQVCYPDLAAIPEPVDLVLIFIPSNQVPRIVDQAIEIGARVVWMQEGIINEAAAQKASQAGLEVVMDNCIRITHKRLFET
jgi:signal transduction histidine kinase/predicted CoA-binding protein